MITDEAIKDAAQIYELAFLLKDGSGESALSEALSSLGAEIVSKSPVNEIKLAYPIKKHVSALFGFYHFKLGEGALVEKISEDLKHRDFLIRFLIVKVEPKKIPATPRLSPEARQEAREKKAIPAVQPASQASLPGRQSGATPITRLDNLSNEKLEETLEEILK